MGKIATTDPKAKVWDGENEVELVKEGSQVKIKIQDLNSRELLAEIYKQIRIMNAHLEIITGEDFKHDNL